MRDLLGAAVLITCSFPFSMSCAVPVADNSESQRSSVSDVDDRVANTEAELLEPTTHCLDANVPRALWSYADNRYANFQTFSKDLPPAMRDWWNRTDCAALIVDWVRNPAIGRDGYEGFIAGIIDPGVVSQDTCPYLWQAQKIVMHSQSSSSQWITHVTRNDEPGCDGSHLWLGHDSASPSAWFNWQSPIRVIVQGFYSYFPVPVSAYLTTSNLGPCPPDFCCTYCSGT